MTRSEPGNDSFWEIRGGKEVAEKSTTRIFENRLNVSTKDLKFCHVGTADTAQRIVFSSDII